MASGDTPTEPNSEMLIYDFDPRNIPSDMLQAIGLVVAASAQTESVVQELIGGLLRIDNLQARALTAHMSAPLKDQIARSLAELDAPSTVEIDKLDDLLDAVNQAYEKRNLVVHNAIVIHPETGEIFSFREKARGSLQVALKPITVEQIEKDALAIYECGMAVMSFMIVSGVKPRERTAARNRPIDRGPKARTKRRNIFGGNAE